MLMEVCKDFGIKKLCFQYVNEGFKVVFELVEFGVGVFVFVDWWVYKFEVYYFIVYNVFILMKNGVVIFINLDLGEFICYLYYEVGKIQ